MLGGAESVQTCLQGRPPSNGEFSSRWRYTFRVKMKDNECAKNSACFFFLHGRLKKIYVSLYITPRTVLGS